MKTFMLIIALFFLACNNRYEKDPIIRSQSRYFSHISENDLPLHAPQKGEWLFDHKEKGQTFEAYKKANPIKPTAGRSVIYLLPVGNFTTLQEKALRLTRDYVEIFFQQKAVLLTTIPDNTVPRRQRGDNIQLLAPYVLDSLLKDKTPKDGIALMAISAKDLYPKEEWNYVFGLASYTKRVGVTSIYRLQNQTSDTAVFSLCLRRLINISSHELGHMMSIHHCTFAKCTMNGSNSLNETDGAPNRLCSECQQKLYWNFRYDNNRRLQQLNKFFQENNLQKDLYTLKPDLDPPE